MIVEKANDYIKRAAKGDRPFFAYVALSHVHPPEKAHPDFDQTDPTRLGMYADLIAEMDHRVGQIVDCVDQAGKSPSIRCLCFQATTQRFACPPSRFWRFERPLARRLLHPSDRGVHAGASHGSLAGQGARGGGDGRDAVGARLVQDIQQACAPVLDNSADRPTDGSRVDTSKFLLGQSQHTGRDALLFFGARNGG